MTQVSLPRVDEGRGERREAWRISDLGLCPVDGVPVGWPYLQVDGCAHLPLACKSAQLNGLNLRQDAPSGAPRNEHNSTVDRHTAETRSSLVDDTVQSWYIVLYQGMYCCHIRGKIATLNLRSCQKKIKNPVARSNARIRVQTFKRKKKKKETKYTEGRRVQVQHTFLGLCVPGTSDVSI